MRYSVLPRLCALVSLCLSTSAFATGTPGMTIEVATIAAGKLVITGAASPNIYVKIIGTGFQTKANAQGKFAFNVDYRTPNCRIALANAHGWIEFQIANCGPKGEKGDEGDRGPMGWRGPQGQAGVQGPAGPKGTTGATGPQGPAGLQGPQGIRGLSGAFANVTKHTKHCTKDGTGWGEVVNADQPELYCAAICPVGDVGLLALTEDHFAAGPESEVYTYQRTWAAVLKNLTASEMDGRWSSEYVRYGTPPEDLLEHQIEMRQAIWCTPENELWEEPSSVVAKRN